LMANMYLSCMPDEETDAKADTRADGDTDAEPVEGADEDTKADTGTKAKAAADAVEDTCTMAEADAVVDTGTKADAVTYSVEEADTDAKADSGVESVEEADDVEEAETVAFSVDSDVVYSGVDRLKMVVVQPLTHGGSNVDNGGVSDVMLMMPKGIMIGDNANVDDLKVFLTTSF
jgi:membrane protein involved in colicin uptake